MLNHFNKIPECDRQTESRTDILQQQSLRYAWHRAAKIKSSITATP